MTDQDSRIARLEERMADAEEWRRSCAAFPSLLTELVLWKKEQNGDIRQLKRDVSALHDEFIARRSITGFLKWAIGIVGLSGAITLANLIMEALK